MNLNDAQRQKVAAWVADGLKLSEIQNRLASELDVRLTYMETRLLVDDLRLTLKDPDPPKTVVPVAAPPAAIPPPAAPGATPLAAPDSTAPPLADGSVSVTVDQITRPGALVSGKVTFSDGITADWYLDQTGRLGVVPKQPGYKPSAQDVQQFQMALEREMVKLGL